MTTEKTPPLPGSKISKAVGKKQAEGEIPYVFDRLATATGIPADRLSHWSPEKTEQIVNAFRGGVIDKHKFQELRLAVKAVGGLEAYNRLQPLDMFPPNLLDSEYCETQLWEQVYREESTLRGIILCGGCGAAKTMHVQFDLCGKCQSQQYCSRACQVAHWKSVDSHKEQCSRMKREKSALRQQLYDDARTDMVLRWNATRPDFRQILQQVASRQTKEELYSHFSKRNPQQ